MKYKKTKNGLIEVVNSLMEDGQKKTRTKQTNATPKNKKRKK